MFRSLQAALLLVLLGALALPQPRAEEAVPVAVTSNQVAVQPPPMGWASWNSFAANINASVIRAQVDAMVAKGLPTAGYRYVNIDEGWWQGTRDAGERTR